MENLMQFKEKYPALYKEALEVGQATEYDRVMAHVELGKENNAFDVAFDAIEKKEGLSMQLQAKYLNAGMSARALSAREEDNVEIGEQPEVRTSEALSKEDETDKAMRVVMEKMGLAKGGK